MRIGIDLGGTNIAAGLVDDQYNIIAKKSVKTLTKRPPQEILADMVQVARDVSKEAGVNFADIDYIGIGSPGIIDGAKGIVLYSNNVRWDNVEVGRTISEALDKPVFMDNDANCAVLGEFLAGAAKGVNSVAAITLGTGVGSGIIIDGKIYKSFNPAVNHAGHMVIVSGGVRCTCGRRGCWESYASVSALIRMASELADMYPDCGLAEARARDGELNGRNIFDAGKQGDVVAQELLQKYFYYISEGITNIINILQPEMIIIGGGISKEGDYLLEPVKRHVAENVFCKAVPLSAFKIASLGNDAGIIGAAYLKDYQVR